jgi:hypothetical protein
MQLRNFWKVGPAVIATALVFGATPSMADSLTDRVVHRLRQADPNITLNQVDENQLKLTKEKRGIVVYLDNLRRSCRLEESGCARDMQTLVKTSIELLAPTDDQHQDSRRLRIVIRGQDYLQEMTQVFNQQRKVPSRFVYKTLSDSLVALMVVDSPQAVSPLDEESLSKMALSPQGAWSLASNQTFEVLKSIELNPLDKNVFGLGGNYFSPAWLLSAHWEKFTRDNAVDVAWACVYDADQAIFAFNDPAKLRNLQRGCPVWVRKAKRPVSERLMVWTKGSAQWETLRSN